MIRFVSGVGGEVTAADRAKCIVFINNVAFEVMKGPFNVRQAFGNETVLMHSSGPVLTDEWGNTLQPLQHGAYYYLVCTFVEHCKFFFSKLHVNHV